MASSSSPYERGIQDGARHRAATEPNWIRSTLGPVFGIGVPLVISFFLLRRLSRGTPFSMKGAPGSENGKDGFRGLMESMLPLQKRQFRVDVKGTTFRDVVGIPEAKEEVAQYVEFLQRPQRFTRLGARLPKGCLLTGEPGTGKTLLAKAVAGEASVPFFSCNGADFIEVVSGSGPKRIRELFEEARQTSPCIVFIDEIDAIGSRAGGDGSRAGGSVSSEENRTVNQLLAELDGLSTSEDPIVVMAATNFEDNIDKALLREGRFDRKVQVEMPDRAARIDVFQHYLQKICTGDPNGRTHNEAGEKIAVDPSVRNDALAEKLADLTPGISPASVAAVVNEAALQAGIANEPNVNGTQLTRAVDNVLLGKKQRNRQSDNALRRTAIHESGHALIMWMLPPQKNVLKISIEPRGNVQGYTQKAGAEHHEYQTNATLFGDMVALLGGRAAEEVVLGTASAGAVDDLQKCTDLAMKKMLAFGMSGGTDVGLLSYHPQSTSAGRSFVSFSEDTQGTSEAAAQRVVAAAHEFGVALIRTHRSKVEAMADQLLQWKEMQTKDIEVLWGARPAIPTLEDLLKYMVEKKIVLG